MKNGHIFITYLAPIEKNYCTSKEFINGFNEDGRDLHKTQKEFTLYGTLFNLDTLKDHINETLTEKVFVIADIVYMTKSLLLTYDLSIRARKVFINKSLKMDIGLKKFKFSDGILLLFWTETGHEYQIL